jgi:peptidoglycan glycosyltransferase
MNVSTNIRKLTNIFILLFLALSGALVYWQVVAAQEVTGSSHNSRHCFSDAAPIRGNIFDRNGILLAYTMPGSSGSCGFTRVYTDPSLAGLIGYDVLGYPKTGIESAYCTVLSGGVKEDDYCTLPSAGLNSNGLSNTIDSILHRPPVGNDIYLTIDERIQKIADGHFDDPAAGTQSNKGSIIVSDPHTGEVLAMVSRPTFDPNQLVTTLQKSDLSYYNQLLANPDNPLLERPLEGLYAPGSIYKAMTLVAGLDSGNAHLNDTFDKEHAVGPITIAGQKIGPEGNNIDLPDANPPYTHHYPVNVEYGFTHSDNIIFAQIGVKTGFDTWMDYNKRFYVGEKIPFDLPVTVSQVLPRNPDGSLKDKMADNELAADAFGQGTDFVTPFQMTLLNNAIANNGQLMRPRLVLKLTDHQEVTDPNTNHQTLKDPDPKKNYQGNPVQTFDQQELGTRQFSQKTATDARQAMYGVTFCGSGLLVPPLVGSKTSIISKTGTAQVGGPGTDPHGWMITEAPYSVTRTNQLPVLTIVAMKENVGHGGDAVGPLIAHTYEDVFSQIPEYKQNQFPPLPTTGDYCRKTGLLQI